MDPATSHHGVLQLRICLQQHHYMPMVTADLDMRTVVIYFGETYRSGHGGARLSLLKNTPYALQWFNPRAGLFTVIAEQAHPVNGTLVIPDKPDGGDWIFLARAL